MKKLFSFLVTIFFLFIGFNFSASASDRVHVVKNGETFWRICQNYDVSYEQVLNLNPSILNPEKILTGQQIFIPGFNVENNKASKKTSAVAPSNMAAEVIELVNKERVSRGLQPLALDSKLQECAQTKAQDMVNKNYFAHTSPTYGSPFNMMEQWGIKFTAAGENIAQGQKTPAEVMTSWMNSPGHRSNILSESFSEIGVGVASNSNGVLYWSQMFMRPAIGH